MRFLSDLRGDLSTAELARATGLSRFALTRIYNGEARPKGPVFLLLIQACSRRVLDFLARLTSVEAIPSLAVLWQQQQARRDAATRSPWALAVLCALELDEYRALPEHVTSSVLPQLHPTIPRLGRRGSAHALQDCWDQRFHGGEGHSVQRRRSPAGNGQRRWMAIVPPSRRTSGHGACHC